MTMIAMDGTGGQASPAARDGIGAGPPTGGTVVVVGSGTMGAGIAGVFARAGWVGPAPRRGSGRD